MNITPYLIINRNRFQIELYATSRQNKQVDFKYVIQYCKLIPTQSGNLVPIKVPINSMPVKLTRHLTK